MWTCEFVTCTGTISDFIMEDEEILLSLLARMHSSSSFSQSNISIHPANKFPRYKDVVWGMSCQSHRASCRRHVISSTPDATNLTSRKSPHDLHFLKLRARDISVKQQEVEVEKPQKEYFISNIQSLGGPSPNKQQSNILQLSSATVGRKSIHFGGEKGESNLTRAMFNNREKPNRPLDSRSFSSFRRNSRGVHATCADTDRSSTNQGTHVNLDSSSSSGWSSDDNLTDNTDDDILSLLRDLNIRPKKSNIYDADLHARSRVRKKLPTSEKQNHKNIPPGGLKESTKGFLHGSKDIMHDANVRQNVPVSTKRGGAHVATLKSNDANAKLYQRYIEDVKMLRRDRRHRFSQEVWFKKGKRTLKQMEELQPEISIDIAGITRRLTRPTAATMAHQAAATDQNTRNILGLSLL